MANLFEKYQYLYPSIVLAVVSIGFVIAELGHFLIGVTSKAMATDLHYGDIACQLNNTNLHENDLPMPCSTANNSETCLSYTINGSSYCEWNYNGLGLEYQVLAGPTFILVYTIVGVAFGFAADKYNRVIQLTACAFINTAAIVLSGAVNAYWQLLLLRMLLAVGEAGINPLATGILSDIFPEKQRALVMAIFNWGIYGGYGIAFPVGRYVTKLNIGGQGWRACYYISGFVGLIISFLTWGSLREPERKVIGAEATEKTLSENGEKKATGVWDIICDPRIIMLCLAASIRHCGGLTFAYNCDLYYLHYFPTYDLSWWLFAVTIVIGSIGVVAGGVVSDKFVAQLGVKSRVLCLAISQLIATLPAFGSVYFDPLWAMITLGISYFFAEMWFGILFAILVEIVPLQYRSTTVGIFLFVMNNIGGNLPIAVEGVSKAVGYREGLYVFYAGAYGISSILFLLTVFLMREPKNTKEEITMKEKDLGHDNRTFSNADETQLPTVTSFVNGKHRQSGMENSRL